MTEQLFRTDAYLTQATGTVIAHTDAGGIVLDRSLFYATGGGQPGDGGTLEWSGTCIEIATCSKSADEALSRDS